MLTPAFPLLKLPAITTAAGSLPGCFNHGGTSLCHVETVTSPALIQSLMKSRKRFTSSSEALESFPKTDVLFYNMGASGIHHLSDKKH